MKPKNKFQQRVIEASRKLPRITQVQIEYAYRNCIEHIGRRTSKGIITCTDCGHVWQGSGYLADTLTECHCPECGMKLTVKTTRERTFYDYEYLCIITACEGYQVLRYLYVECRTKIREKARYTYLEAVQRWIAPDGKYATFARLRPQGYFVHGWCNSSSLELRPEKSMYNIIPTCVYPRQKLIPEVKRSGYTTVFGKLTPFDLIHNLLSEQKAEILLKCGQRELLHYFIYNSRNINDYWTAIRIATRNEYHIDQPGEWCDYIDLLRFFGKDLHNACFVCPVDLKGEHDRYVAKKQRYMEQQRQEEAKRKALINEARFIEMKGRFFGIEFTDGVISVKVLESVDAIRQEGDTMHHCVFTNEYYLRPDSLILSATINGKRIETIEVSLSRLAAVQSRGVCNQLTEHHARIMKLVKRNMPLIHKRITA